MNQELPNFSTATYLEPAPAAALPAPQDSALLARSIAFGLAGALAGAVLYAGFIHLTHINLGYLSIGIAYLVAKAMTLGSGERGGRPFQISALVLTCLAVAAGNALMLFWSLSARQPVPLTPHNLYELLRFGALQPFLEFKESIGSALLDLFILFIGLRAAWRMTSGLPGAVRHPFSR